MHATSGCDVQATLALNTKALQLQHVQLIVRKCVCNDSSVRVRVCAVARVLRTYLGLYAGGVLQDDVHFGPCLGVLLKPIQDLLCNLLLWKRSVK